MIYYYKVVTLLINYKYKYKYKYQLPMKIVDFISSGIKFFIGFFLMLLTIGLNAQTMKLKVPTDLYYGRIPGQNKRIKLSITNKKQEVMMIVTDNKNNPDSKRLTVSSQLRGQGSPTFLMMIPKLYRIGNDGSDRIYNFGRGCAEGGEDDASLRLTYQNDNPSPNGPSSQPTVRILAEDNEIHTGNGSDQSIGAIEKFLRIEASRTKTATLQINRKPERGQVIIAVFDAKNGNLLGTLDPKNPSDSAPNQSLTVDRQVFVIPFIRPKVSSDNGIDTVVFEVGDPEENGRVRVEEE